MKVKNDDEIIYESSKSKSYSLIHDYNEGDNDYYYDDNNDDYDEIDDQFLFETINNIKYIFINHFNLTNRTIAEFLNDNQITTLIDLYVKL